MSNDPSNIHINVNLDAPKGDLQRSIQRIIYLVSGALNSATEVANGPLTLPEVGFQSIFDSSLIWSPSEVRTELKTWVLQNGFRDAVESLSIFLEKIHSICSVWAMIQKQNNGQQLTGADLQLLQEIEPKQFHRLGLPDKIDHLRDKHGIHISDHTLNNALSSNTARNCLVHRNGVVGEKDATDGKLLVSWRRMKLLARNEDGENELVTGLVYDKETTIGLKFVDESKTFMLGEPISLSVQEFQNIAWSLFHFSTEVTTLLSDWGLAHGFVSPAPGSQGE